MTPYEQSDWPHCMFVSKGIIIEWSVAFDCVFLSQIPGSGFCDKKRFIIGLVSEVGAFADNNDFAMMRVWTAFLNRIQIIVAINVLERSKVAGLDGLPVELIIDNPVIFTELLLLFIRNSWEFKIFLKELKKGVIVKTLKKVPPLEWDNWRGICVLPAVAKIITKIFLKTSPRREIDGGQTGFRSGSSCTDHINAPWIIVKQCASHALSILRKLSIAWTGSVSVVFCARGGGIPEKVIATIRATNAGANYYVLYRGKILEDFEVKTGVPGIASCHRY